MLANYGIDGLKIHQSRQAGDRIKVRLTCKEEILRVGMGHGEVRLDRRSTNENAEPVVNYGMF